MDKILKNIYTFTLFVILLLLSLKGYSQNESLPVIKIPSCLDSNIYNKIPDFYGKYVSCEKKYFKNLHKSDAKKYFNKLIKLGYVKLYDFSDYYGFMKDNYILLIDMFRKSFRNWTVEIDVKWNKTDKYLEKGELNIKQLIDIVNKKTNKNYNQKDFIVRHAYMKYLWAKMKAQVVIFIDKNDNKDYLKKFKYFDNGAYIDKYLVQNNQVCKLYSWYLYEDNINYTLIDFDKDGEYELEENVHIRRVGDLKAVFKNGKIIYEKRTSIEDD